MYSVLVIILLCVPALGFDSSSGDSDSSASAEGPYNQLIVFGDSYSDTGNVYNLLTNRTYPISPPNYQGRYCNGLNWVDVINVKHKEDYAYGSATTDNNVVVGLTKGGTIVVPGIRQQVATYLSQTRPKKVQRARRVHAIWGIGNNFIFSKTATPVGSVNSLMDSVTDLLNADAQTIVVFNSQPSQLSPFTRATGQSPAAALAGTTAINNLIVANLTTIKQKYPHANIYLFDDNALLTKIISNNSTVKFADTTNPCWIVINATTVTTPCPNPNDHVFIDLVHVSAPVHQLIAAAVQQLFARPRPNANTAIPYFTAF